MDYISKNSFSFTRLMMILKREYISSRKTLRMQALVAFGLIAMIEFFITWITYRNWTRNAYFYSSEAIDVSSLSVLGCFIFLAILLLCISASFSFTNLKSKPRRINTFMTVGLQSEKFLSRIAIYIVGTLLFLLISFIFVDLLRCLFIAISTNLKPIFCFSRVLLSDYRLVIIVILTIILYQTFFMTVSVFSPGRAFIKGLIVLFTINTICMFCVFNLNGNFINFMFNVSHHSIHNTLFYITSVAETALIVIMYIASYLRYTETDLK